MHINAPGGDANLAKLSGYLAKYVTKSTEVTGQIFRRIDDMTAKTASNPNPGAPSGSQ